VLRSLQKLSLKTVTNYVTSLLFIKKRMHYVACALLLSYVFSPGLGLFVDNIKVMFLANIKALLHQK